MSILRPVYIELVVYLELKKATMKVRLTLTIDEDVLKRAKLYAKTTNTSISKMVQDYLDKITKNEKDGKKSIDRKKIEKERVSKEK